MGVRRSWLLWLLAGCGPLLLALFALELAVFGGIDPFRGAAGFENTYPNIVFGLIVPPLGALILTRLPRHPIGWVFMGCGLASAVTLAVYPYAHEGLGHRDLPGALAAAWVSEWIWGLGLIPLVTLGVLLFPDGRPPTPRWRWMLWSDVTAVVLVFLSNAFHPGRLQNHPAATNPLGLPLPDVVFAVLTTAGMGLFLVGFVGGALSAIVRWRRAHGPERAQLAWFAFAAATLAVAFFVPWPARFNTVIILVAVPLLPLSVAAAILRGHLYGIEVVVRRSLIYATMTVVLLIWYAVTVAALGALLRGRAGGVPALVATALVAIAFAPVRQRAQRGVDRLLYGEGRDPYAVLTGVGRRLEQPLADPESVLADVAGAVAESLRLPYVRVEMTADGAVISGAEAGSPVPGVHEVPLTFRGEVVGRLLAAPRSSRDPFRPADLRLLDDLGRQIGVAVHATRLAHDLQRSREGLVTMREEERRRIRRDLHDGLGPALAGVALGLDAVQRMARPSAEEAADLADQLKVEMQQSLADVRRLVEDLRPPDLDQLGLVGALRHQAGRITERDPGLEVEVAGEALPQLPAAVEVAAYRIATEALTNVGRHAAARTCRIQLAMDDPTGLRVEIEDDGVGVLNGRPGGVGLAAMRERATELGGSLRVCRREQGGTLVTARLPVAGP